MFHLLETKFLTLRPNEVILYAFQTSHFKTYDTNHEYTNPEVVKDSFLEDENKVFINEKKKHFCGLFDKLKICEIKLQIQTFFLY